ncbi:MAG: helix-turn-helix domain-containing protein [Alphaproteobacteria bacterium]
MSNGRKIIEGSQEAVAYARGERTGTKVTVVHVPKSIDVRALRERLGMTQEEFAVQFGFSLGAVRHWEQGCRYPVGSARVLLKVIEHDPDAVKAALAVA